MENVVKLLNRLLELDRSGISHFFICNNARVNIDIQHTPVELTYIGSDSYALLDTIGLINGVLHCTGTPTQRLMFELRDPATIENFYLAYLPSAEQSALDNG